MNEQKQPIDSEIYNRLKEISEMSWQMKNKLLAFLETVKPKQKQRTYSQNRALHLWYEQKAEQCRNAGISPRMAFEKTIELEMTAEIMKEIWRAVQKALYKKKSTTELSKGGGEIYNLVEHLNRFFAGEPFNLEGLPLPNDEDKAREEMTIPKPYQGEYPTEESEGIDTSKQSF